VVRFSQRDSHQIFVEPEGLTTHEVYPNGISTSLSYDVQEDLVHSIKGFENAKLCVQAMLLSMTSSTPVVLKQTLEVKKVSGLILQDKLMAQPATKRRPPRSTCGINAALKVHKIKALGIQNVTNLILELWWMT
jgi:tRNA uridine 5-carboxymethylaminomethyl modification enzyme